MNYDSLFALRRARHNPIDFLQQLAARGDVAEFSLRQQRAFLVNHPSLIEEVLVTHAQTFVKPPALRRARQLLGQGLLSAEGELHQARRRTISPAFANAKLNGCAEVIIERAGDHCGRWQDGSTIDIAAEMQLLALRIVGEVLFSSDLSALAPELRHLLDRATSALDPLITVIAPARRIRPERRRLHEIVDAIIERRRSQMGPPDDLLTLLLAATGPEATAEQLRDDVLTMLLAGHDTIANALAWTVAQVAAAPDVSKRLAAELEDVLGRRALGVDSLQRLVYTRATVAESLRLRPPAWILARRAIAPHRLGGHDVPEGSLVVISPYVAHRDARFFPDPLRFDPERWLRIAPSDRLKLGFLPFGAGRRSCIGESFAWMEGTLVLATLSRSWRFVCIDGNGTVEPRITLRPRGPLRVGLERARKAAGRRDAGVLDTR